MNNEAIYVILIFLSGMAVAILIIFNEYRKYKRSNTLSLKVAQQSPKWNKIKEVLENNFSYYHNLPENLKADFILRTYYFMRHQNWISSSSPRLSLYKKTMISASAIQLTFGLNNFRFVRFRTIMVHEDAYYNKLTQKYHRGEVNRAGLIVLSWKYFEEGYANDSDKFNLGLHEMAHALDLELHLTQGRQYNIHRLMAKFKQSAFDEIVKMRNGNGSFLRNYGSTNTKEFFSVAVEHFFEAPQSFRSKLPELYLELCQLLNQDPINKVYRGFKSQHSTHYHNALKPDALKFIKPVISLKPNANILVPIGTYTLLFALTLPVIKAMNTSLPFVMIGSWGGIYLLIVLLTYNIKGKMLQIAQDYLITKNHLLNNQLDSIHLKNIVNISFTYMLTYYRTNISFFEGEEIKTKSVSLYFSPNKIKKLERILLQQNIKIKHNNKWLKKESS